MRVDKWIWAVRMVKSRTLAGEMCRRGKVRINGENAKPAKKIAIGDRVEYDNGPIYRDYEVVGFIPKRVSAELAALNYEDHTPVMEKAIDDNPLLADAPRRERGEGRPTKKDARALREALGK